VESECAIESCDSGYVDCSSEMDGCETEDAGLPGTPAPFLPMAGAYTGAVRAERSLEPKFAWRAPEADGTCGALTYEIELTRECEPGKLQECAFEDPEVQEAGLEEPEWTPEEPLPVSDVVPVGALYAWRVRACDAPVRCSEWSRVSYVNLGRLIDDINADGYSDLVEVNNLGQVGGVFWGDGATPLAGAAAFAETWAANGGRFVGDVNGDEFPDMVIWDSYSQTAVPRVILGASATQAWTGLPMSPYLNVRHGAARAGDLDADGFADVAVSEFGRAGDTAGASGVVRLYRGGPSFTMSEPTNVLSPAGTTPEGFGAAMVGGSDSNADGYADLYVLDDEDGLLHLLRGSSELPDAISTSIPAPALVTFPTAPAPQLIALDRNGDGYGDVAVHLYYDDDSVSNSVIQVFTGGPELAAEPVASMVVDSNEIIELAGGVDLGEDGDADLLLHLVYGFNTSSGFQSRVRALPGSAGSQSASDLVPIGDFGEVLPNYRNLLTGDYDGDGEVDLTIRGDGAHHLLRGGEPGPEKEGCVQPSASFVRIGDWCSAASSALAATGSGVAVR
jgi:hypothetical protein